MASDGQDRRKSAAIEFAKCGWGVSSGLFPELRLGRVRLWWCRGSAVEMLRELPKLREALKAARDELERRP